jgi:hypothetical protein
MVKQGTRALRSMVWFSVALSALPAAAFVPREDEVCPASARVYDPEFDSETRQMVYYDGNGGIRVAPVLSDGRIDTPDCAGTVVARQTTLSAPGLPFRAGPEWAKSARGTEIYFTKLDRSGAISMARARFDGRWRVTDLPETANRGLALTSADPGDPEPRLMYLHTPSTGQYDLRWREASRPETEGPVPASVDPGVGAVPRWVPGSRALSLTAPGAGGVDQAALFHVDNGTLQWLTADAGNKTEAWIWSAPELGGAAALMVVVDGCCLRFYGDDGSGAFVPMRELRASDFSRRPFIYSPEVLVHEGRSHVVMQLSQQRVAPSEIWLAAPLAEPFAAPVQISDPALRGVARSEPEWMVTSEGVFVYITASESTSRFSLRRLATPLTAPPAR